MECQRCVWNVVSGNWRYCVLHGIWVGDSDCCTSFWAGEDWLNFVIFYNSL